MRKKGTDQKVIISRIPFLNTLMYIFRLKLKIKKVQLTCLSAIGLFTMIKEKKTSLRAGARELFGHD